MRVSDIPDRCSGLPPAEALRVLYEWALTLPRPELDQPIDITRAERVADYLSTTTEVVIGNPHGAYMRVIATREERDVTEFVAAALAFAAERGVSESAFLDRLPESLAENIRNRGARAPLTWHDVRSLTRAAELGDPGLLHYKLDPSDPDTRRFRNAMIAASALSFDAHRPVELRDYDTPNALPD